MNVRKRIKSRIWSERCESDLSRICKRLTALYVAKETLGLTPLSTARTQPGSAVGPSSGRKQALGIPLQVKDNNSKREILALPSIQLYVRLEAFWWSWLFSLHRTFWFSWTSRFRILSTAATQEERCRLVWCRCSRSKHIWQERRHQNDPPENGKEDKADLLFHQIPLKTETNQLICWFLYHNNEEEIRMTNEGMKDQPSSFSPMKASSSLCGKISPSRE